MKAQNEILFEQYKLYAESAEMVSDRRQNANNFFLTLNSALLAFTGFLTTLQLAAWHILIVIAGLSISIMWLLTLRSYRNLNTCKFKVIHELEKKLPGKVFTCEWDYLGQGKSKRKYLRLSKIEKGVPLIFCVLYISIIILMVTS